MIKFEVKKNAAKNTAKNTANNFKNKIEENSVSILEYLKEHPTTTQKNIMENFNLSRRTIERIIATLKEEGKIERVGNNRSGYWKILK